MCSMVLFNRRLKNRVQNEAQMGFKRGSNRDKPLWNLIGETTGELIVCSMVLFNLRLNKIRFKERFKRG